MRDAEFLNWVADRLVHVYDESENVDFVLKLRRMAKKIEIREADIADIKKAVEQL